MTQEQIQKEIRCYNSTGRLTTHPYLTCTASGQKVMAFGPMLKKKIERYGGLEKMLSTFISRKAQSAAKPPKPQKIQKRKSKKTKESLISVENGVYVIPPFKNEPTKSLLLEENPSHTIGACWRPDIFLNSGRVCDTCHLSSYCLSNCKKFSNKKIKHTYA